MRPESRCRGSSRQGPCQILTHAAISFVSVHPLHRLNYINDFDPVSHNFKKPVYAIEAYVTKTGQLDCCKPKGTWDNPTKRNWLKYEVSRVLVIDQCLMLLAVADGLGD